MNRTKVLIHKVFEMYSCQAKGKSLLLMNDDLRRLIDIYLHDVSKEDIAKFTFAISTGLRPASNHDKYYKLQKRFLERLVDNWELKERRVYYDMRGEEAKKYLPDFLEGYRHSYKNIDYTISNLIDGSEKII
ncbi:hypothetical protein SG34_021220 [Thalassomonas viridans]|uniref:Uncharacterized protein n=1 Tax=Thalassomonas viridans TaxID=137584 RepID=A0AAE9Z284_9GAMM|nr:hypothetical protein [Thalassomonas viridans]WDE03872.1 hypothetical protein SG34_021220 [Thalassomonas viridans]